MRFCSFRKSYFPSGILQSRAWGCGIVTTVDAAGTHTYGHRGGLPSGESIAGGLLVGVIYAHPNDEEGRRTSFAASWGGTIMTAVAYGYDAVNRLQCVSHGPDSSTYAYHPNSDFIASVTHRRNGAARLVTTYGRDAAGRFDEIVKSLGGGQGVLAEHHYTYDRAHRRVANHCGAEGSARWFDKYNRNRRHQALAWRIPHDVYFDRN